MKLFSVTGLISMWITVAIALIIDGKMKNKKIKVGLMMLIMPIVTFLVVAFKVWLGMGAE